MSDPDPTSVESALPRTVLDVAGRWNALRAEAPDLEERVRARFAANLHHVIATLRPDGSPRLSGTEVPFGPSGPRIGMMPGSRKLADVRRDPRVEMHSAPIEEDLAEGDARLSGRLVEVENREADHPGAGFFELLLITATLVRVDGDELVISVWDPGSGYRQTRRR